MKLSEDRYKDFFGIPPPIDRKSQDSREESIILESANVVHGENCHKIGCKCTPIKDCNKNDEERWQQHRDSQKGRYVGVRARRAKKQEQQQQRKLRICLGYPNKMMRTQWRTSNQYDQESKAA
jgi:hypothetical protein